MRNKSRKRILPLRWLAFLVLLTALGSSVTLSRYITTVSGSDTARVAKFHVTMAEKEKSLDVEFQDMIPGVDAQWEFTVTSNSDTASVISAKLEGTSNLPLTYTIQEIGGGTASVTMNGDFIKIADISYGENIEKTFVLNAVWNEVSYSDYYDQIDTLCLTVKAEQAN